MKKLFAILGIAALALPAYAQFVPGPRQQSALASTPFKFIHGGGGGRTTNLTASAPMFTLKNGSLASLYVQWATTNADYSSNVVFFFEGSQDGVNWYANPLVVDQTNGFSVWGAPSVTLTLPLAGSVSAVQMTNLPAPYGSTTLNANIRFVRLAAITNVATATTNSFWITNCWFVAPN